MTATASSLLILSSVIFVSSLVVGLVAKRWGWTPKRCYWTAQGVVWTLLALAMLAVFVFLPQPARKGFRLLPGSPFLLGFITGQAGSLARKIAFPTMRFGGKPSGPLVPAGDRTVEHTTLQAFLKPHLRGRYLAILKDGRGSLAMLDRLGQNDDLDTRYTRKLRHVDDWTSLMSTLRELGAPATCYVLSQDDRINGMYLPLEQALERVYASGMDDRLMYPWQAWLL